MRFLNEIQSQIDELKSDNFSVGELNDGYHSFNELYRFRLLYNAALFNEWAKQGLYDGHTSSDVETRIIDLLLAATH